MGKTLQSNLTDPKSAREKEIAGLGPWFHNLHLPDGSQTAPDHPLGDFPAFKWEQIAPGLPRDLSRWSVLDIGCNAGFYSFELARLGAKVTAIDADPRYLRQAEWAAREFGLREQIEFRQSQVYDLARLDESYDLVWFMGVLYHLRYPMLALDLIARKTKRLLVFQALTIPGDEKVDTPEDLPMDRRDRLREEGWPKMAFVEHRLAGDPTNWWVPNQAGVEAMLQSSGFTIAGRPGHEIYLCHPKPSRERWEEEWVKSQYAAATGVDWP